MGIQTTDVQMILYTTKNTLSLGLGLRKAICLITENGRIYVNLIVCFNVVAWSSLHRVKVIYFLREILWVLYINIDAQHSG